MSQRLFLCFLFLGLSVGATAQIKVPLQQAGDRNLTDPKFANMRVSANSLTLPFFDDFAESDVQLNPTRWFLTGGTHVNNTFAVGQPTKNVVTFDGLKADGQPYSFTALNKGNTDVLTSRPIDLSSYTPNDAVYLSFAWQGGGVGHAPGPLASLNVLFKNRGGNWVSPSQGPNDAIIPGAGSTGFKQWVIKIPGSASSSNLSFYHDSFQFRFQSSGYQGGSADIFNIDYVLLDANRSPSDTVHYDLAVASRPTPFLRPYFSMPVHQYLANPGNFTANSVRQDVKNLHNIFRVARSVASIKNLQDNTSEILRDSSNFYEAFSRTTVPVYDIQTPGISTVTDWRDLEYEFHLVSPELDREPEPYRHNDTIRQVYPLQDYFAYDDGSAESAYLLLGPSGAATDQAAVRFDIPVADFLGAIDIYFAAFRDNIQGNTITLKVWEANADGRPGAELHSQPIQVNYNSINHFTRVKLNQPIPVNGSFFIGWRQSQASGPRYALGLDLNTNSSQFRYFGNSSTGTWFDEILLEGSLMIRAVMGEHPITGTSNLIAGPGLQIFPNPSTGIFRIEGEYNSLHLFDMQGRMLGIESFVINNGQIDLSGLPAGMYVLRAEQGDKVSTHKLVLTNP